MTERVITKFNIGFDSYPPNTPISHALDNSYRLLLSNRRQLLRLALIPPVAKGSQSKLLIINPERGIIARKRIDCFQADFTGVLECRSNNHHYTTDLTRVSKFPNELYSDLANIKFYTQRWSNWCLFPKYESTDSHYPGAEFGFVAKRTSKGTLITSRASNKENPKDSDYALITNINDATIHTTSTGRKASLNAPLAYYIFKNRPEINYIVHSHIFLPKGSDTEKISTPSTQEDWQSIKELVKKGKKIINQPMHGTLILLENPEDLLEILKCNSLYNCNSELYDQAYSRFQGRTNLEDVVESLHLAGDCKVLDLCCGTGASTQALIKLGFSNIDIADGSKSMLAVAKTRLQKDGTLISLPSLNGLNTVDYDLITMRQAFNYVTPNELATFASNIAKHLKTGGKFVFNTFLTLSPGIIPRNNPDKEDENTLIRTREINHIDRNRVLHTQRSEILDFNKNRWDALLDINEFYQYDLDDVESKFKSAGFNVEKKQKGNSICFTCTKNKL